MRWVEVADDETRIVGAKELDGAVTWLDLPSSLAENELVVCSDGCGALPAGRRRLRLLLLDLALQRRRQLLSAA